MIMIIDTLKECNRIKYQGQWQRRSHEEGQEGGQKQIDYVQYEVGKRGALWTETYDYRF